MSTLSYKTVSANKATINKEWVLVDAEGQTLGRMASVVALILRGKHKPTFTPHVDCGDNVIVINAEKITMSGNKLSQKQYITHSGYPGGQKRQTVEEAMVKYPERVIERAVKGMLPKSKLGRALFGNLKVVAGSEHKYEAQQPKVIDLNSIR